MTFYQPKTRKIIEVLNDLVRIHDDRVSGYGDALKKLINIGTELHDDFDKIISDSISYKRQLLQKINELNGSTRTYLASPFFGKIYRAWMDLKVAFSGNTQKAIIGSCKYNEEIALHAYRAALNVKTDMTEDVRQLIEAQECQLRKVYEKIKQYREARHVVDYRTLYFT